MSDGLTLSGATQGPHGGVVVVGYKAGWIVFYDRQRMVDGAIQVTQAASVINATDSSAGVALVNRRYVHGSGYTRIPWDLKVSWHDVDALLPADFKL